MSFLMNSCNDRSFSCIRSVCLLKIPRCEHELNVILAYSRNAGETYTYNNVIIHDEADNDAESTTVTLLFIKKSLNMHASQIDIG